MTEEQQPRVHAQDPAEGADSDQREADDQPQARPQQPVEGADDESATPETTEGDV